MAIYMEKLQKGDIIFQHKANTQIKSSLTTHAAIVAQQLIGFRRPLIFDITVGFGFAKRTLSSLPYPYWSAYRADSRSLAAKAALVASCWITQSPALQYTQRTGRLSSYGVYSISSIITSFLGSSYYGPKAMQYARYLHTECLTKPPREIHPGTARWFSGSICSYLPAALFQAAAGPPLTRHYMAIDPRKSLPRDLAKYLDSSPKWRFLGVINTLASQ